MTYIDLLNDFNQWLESNALPCSSQLMYFRLLNVFNRAGWPEYVQVDNLRMMIMTGVESRQATARARDKLVEAGFITFQKGKKGSPCRYWLVKKGVKNVPLSVPESVPLSVPLSVPESVPENVPHIKTKNKTKTNTPVLPDGNTAPRGRMTPPTVAEVTVYCRERGNSVNPEAFVDFYASKGWMVGKNPMRDWKAAVRTWERSEGRNQPRWAKPEIPKGASGQLGDAELEAIRQVLAQDMGG